MQTAQRPSNASTSQLADIVTTIRDEAEHKAASAVAAEIIAAIFERNPTDDPPPAYFRAAAAPDADELAEEGKKIAQVGFLAQLYHGISAPAKLVRRQGEAFIYASANFGSPRDPCQQISRQHGLVNLPFVEVNLNCYVS